jgi:hypothetical protein
VSLSFELGFEDGGQEEVGRIGDGGKMEEVPNTEWLSTRKVKVHSAEYYEGELGDSCCFGTTTVEVGLDCVWKLHGGV